MTASSRDRSKLVSGIRFGLLLLLAALAILSWQAVNAAWGDQTADSVLGQVDFEHNDPLPPNPDTLILPTGAWVDKSSGRLFVADYGHNRVQSWPDATHFGIHAAADITIDKDAHGTVTLDPISTATDSSGNLYIAELMNSRVLVCSHPTYTCSTVIGQQYLTATLSNQGPPYLASARTLSGPYALTIDSNNHLYVADQNNNRVLRYTLPIQVNNAAADLVLGQQSFTSTLSNRGQPVAANGLYWPQGLAVDGAGNLFVADTLNNRVLRFDVPLSNGKAASLVLGQANFADSGANHGTAIPTAQTLNKPNGLAMDRYDRLYVADNANSRVLGYEARELSNGIAARFVAGQPDFGPIGYDPSGLPSDVSLAYPYGLALDTALNLYVADTYNNRVLRYDLPWEFTKQLPMVSK